MSFWRKLTLLALAGFIVLVAAALLAAGLAADPRSDREPGHSAHTFLLD